MSRPYSVYDVFTSTPFTGNPLAVVEDATGLDDTAMQKIAREFNFSETTFVFPPEDPANTARVRIFTPTMELAFAGHPTVGTSTALYERGRAGSSLVLELGVGPIPVEIQNGWAEFRTRVPLSVGESISLDEIGRCIGQSGDVVRTDRHVPVLAGLGTDFVLAELNGPAALATAAPDVAAFRAAAGADADRLALLVYIRDGNQINARMFQPLGGIPEDPATGSAAAALAAWLGRLDGTSQAFDISQGVEMGRPSVIKASVTVEDGEPVEVSIAGQAVKVMEGTLTL